MDMQEFLNSFSQNEKWAIGAIIAFIMFAIAVIRAFIAYRQLQQKKASEVTGVQGNPNIQNSLFNVAQEINITNNATKGIDERDLEKNLRQLQSKKKLDRIAEVENWYAQRKVSSSLKEALLTVIDKIDEDLKAASQEIEKLRKEGQSELADILQRLNKAFEQDGIEGLEKQKLSILEEIKTQKRKTAEKEVAVYFRAAQGYKAGLLYQKSIKEFLTARKIQAENFGEQNLKLSEILNELGILHQITALYDKAIEYYEKSLNISLKALGEEHPSVGSTYNNLGLAWSRKGEYDKAIEYYEKDLNISLKALGEEHPSVGETYNNLGGAWSRKGEYDKAIEYYQQALSIFTKRLPANHPYIKMTKRALSNLP